MRNVRRVCFVDVVVVIYARLFVISVRNIVACCVYCVVFFCCWIFVFLSAAAGLHSTVYLVGLSVWCTDVGGSRFRSVVYVALSAVHCVQNILLHFLFCYLLACDWHLLLIVCCVLLCNLC